MTSTKLPAFILQIGFLEGDFGKAFLEEYQGRVSADYANLKTLNVLRYDNKVVKGSNPFAVVLANQILRQEGLRTATQADLEKALNLGVMPLKATYVDTGLVLRTEEDKNFSMNAPLARDLARQVKARGIKFSSKNPVMIPLTGLEIETAGNVYGLTFRLRENAEIYEAIILREGGSFDSKDIDEKTGLPAKLTNGNRKLYTRNSGLSRLCLVDGLGLASVNGFLDVSYEYGRVVVVKESKIN